MVQPPAQVKQRLDLQDLSEGTLDDDALGGPWLMYKGQSVDLTHAIRQLHRTRSRPGWCEGGGKKQGCTLDDMQHDPDMIPVHTAVPWSSAVELCW